jgi:hypothetical protein
MMRALFKFRSSNRLTDTASLILESYMSVFGDEVRRKYALWFERLGLSYTYIPKNGCSTLKQTFGVAAGAGDDRGAARERRPLFD